MPYRHSEPELLSTTTIISSSISRLCHVALTTHVVNFRFLCHGRRTKWSYLFINCWRDSGKRWIWMRGRERKNNGYYIQTHSYILRDFVLSKSYLFIDVVCRVWQLSFTRVSMLFLFWVGIIIIPLLCFTVFCVVVVSNADSDGEQKGKQQRQRPLK